MDEPTDVERNIEDAEDAVWHALLHILAWSNDEVRELRPLAATTFIRALEQDGYTVSRADAPVPIEAIVAAMADPLVGPMVEQILAERREPLKEARCICGDMPPSRPWNDTDPCLDGNGNWNPGHRYVD